MQTETKNFPVTEDEARAAAALDGTGAPPPDESTDWCEAMEQAEGIDLQRLPTDEEYVDRYGSVLLDLDAEEIRVKTQYERLMARVQKRRLAFQARHLANVEDATRRLLAKAQGKRKNAPKSIDLARCRVGFRLQPEKLDFDIKAVKAFSETYEPAEGAYMVEMVPKESVERSLLKAAVLTYAKEHDGSMPEGITIVGGNDKLYVAEPKRLEE